MGKITAREIVRLAGMCPEPSYYSGRGARRSDLSGERLIAIHKKIKEEIGESQAKEFVTMVRKISCLSATNFLNALFALEANEWVYYQCEESNIDLGPDGPGRMAVGLGSLAGAMFFSGNRDETDLIKNDFLIGLGLSKRMNRWM